MFKLIIIIVIAVVILGYFNFDIRHIAESPQVDANLLYLKEIAIKFFYWIFDLVKALFVWATSSIEQVIK